MKRFVPLPIHYYKIYRLIGLELREIGMHSKILVTLQVVEMCPVDEREYWRKKISWAYTWDEKFEEIPPAPLYSSSDDDDWG